MVQQIQLKCIRLVIQIILKETTLLISHRLKFAIKAYNVKSIHIN